MHPQYEQYISMSQIILILDVLYSSLDCGCPILAHLFVVVPSRLELQFIQLFRCFIDQRCDCILYWSFVLWNLLLFYLGCKLLHRRLNQLLGDRVYETITRCRVRQFRSIH